MKRLLILLALAGCSSTGGSSAGFGLAPEQIPCPPAGLLIPVDSQDDVPTMRRQMLQAGVITAADSLIPLRNRGAIRLANHSEIKRALEREYPRWMVDQYVGGRGLALVEVDSLGRVGRALVIRSSGYTDLDRAIARVVRQMRFEPVQIGGCTAGFWARIPVTFSPPPRDREP